MTDKVDVFIKDAQKLFGKDSIFLPKFKPLNIDWVETGVYAIDDAFGAGIPKGRIIEVFGPESSGKTTLALECVKAMQRAGGKAMFIDAEHSLDPEYAKKIGVDIDNMPLCQPDYGEMGVNMLLSAVKSGAFGIVIVDSVAGLVPKAEIDGEIGDKHMALLAQLMSATCRQLQPECKKTNTTVLFTNQIRNKVGVFFGSPEFQPGGNALKFYASIRADIRKKDTVSEKERFIGIQSQLKIVKNKVAPPFKTVMISILFGKGIDANADLRDRLMSEGRIECRGSTFYLDGKSIGNGKTTADKWLATEFDAYEKNKKKETKKKGGKK